MTNDEYDKLGRTHPTVSLMAYGYWMTLHYMLCPVDYRNLLNPLSIYLFGVVAALDY